MDLPDTHAHRSLAPRLSSLPPIAHEHSPRSKITRPGLSLFKSQHYNPPRLLSGFATRQTDPPFAQISPISETSVRRHPKVPRSPSLHLASFDTYTSFSNPGECMHKVPSRSVGACNVAPCVCVRQVYLGWNDLAALLSPNVTSGGT